MTGPNSPSDCPFKAAAREGGLFEGPVGDDWWKCNCADCQAEKLEAKSKPDRPLKAEGAGTKKRKTRISLRLTLLELAHIFMVLLRYSFTPKFSMIEVILLGLVVYAVEQPFWVEILFIFAICMSVSIAQHLLKVKTT